MLSEINSWDAPGSKLMTTGMLLTRPLYSRYGHSFTCNADNLMFEYVVFDYVAGLLCGAASFSSFALAVCGTGD